jgi:uncharacterized iron-regulated membrane protein
MNLNLLNRKIHYWVSFAFALPLLIIVLSGLVLQVKKQWSWAQPPEQRGSAHVPSIDFDRLLGAAVESVPGTQEWSDVHRVDIRPSRGVAKVILKNDWEVQVDVASGEVLQVAYRRSDWLESLHDGSYFGGDWSRFGVFLPTAVALLWLLISGLWMWWVPFGASRRREARKLAAVAASQKKSTRAD